MSAMFQGPTEPSMRMRWYLEQMMVTFTWSQVHVNEAADLLAEVESHCMEASSGTEPIDPFEEFGDPVKLAYSMIPARKIRQLLVSLASGLLFMVAGLGLIGAIASVLGLDSIGPRSAAVVTSFVACYCISSMMLSDYIRPADPSDKPLSSRRYLVGVGVAVAAGAVTWIMLEPVGAITLRATPLLSLSALAALTGFAFLWVTNRLRGPIETPVHSGVTGQLIEEIRTAGPVEGWVRFGPDGTDLRSEDWSLRRELRKVRDSLTDGGSPTR